MVTSPFEITTEQRFFLEPSSPAQRQYEALRAYFVEGVSTQEASQRFGYTAGSFRVLCHHFRREKPDWFRELKRGPRHQPKKGAARELIVAMRKQNLSVYDIEAALKTQGSPLSCTAIWEILREEGFSPGPQGSAVRGDPQPQHVSHHPVDCDHESLVFRAFNHAPMRAALFCALPPCSALRRTSGAHGSKDTGTDTQRVIHQEQGGNQQVDSNGS